MGSVFRTADGAGVEMLYLSGYTPTPVDRFGRAQKDIAKTALGAEKFLAWKYFKSPVQLIAKLRKEGWRVVAVEQHRRSADYRNIARRKPTLFVFGNEVTGVPEKVLGECDAIVEIPMHGKKESLNVSVAAGIILFHVA